MKKVFESLEKVIADMNLTIIDRYEDEFCIVAAVSQQKKGVFVVYTTKIIASMDPSFALKMFRTTKHLPFKSVTSDKNGTRSFISRYSDAIESGNLLKNIYSSCFCPEEFRFFVNCAG